MGMLKGREVPVLRFQMREKLFGIGDDHWIEDDQGNAAYKVDGKAARLRDTWVLEDADGNEVATIRERKLTIRDAIKIEVGGREATVRRALIGIGERFTIDVDGGPDLKAKGKIGDHEYVIEQGGDKVGEISKKWFRLRDTYGVEVHGGANPALILAITVAIEALAKD